MPVINGVYLKDFPALPSSVADANIIPIAIAGNKIAYRTTVAGIVTDARVTSKLLTGLSVTGSTISATDTILQAFGKVQNQLNGKVTSVGLTMPAAFNVANSPITSAGTLAVTAAGVASQYIRGDGALADFPTNGGGGSSVSYYLNGSVSQGTIGGNTYYEMNKTPVIGTGTDFTINANGYIAQFITDANDPASLLIPAGNWNVEMYFSASSIGGNPSFYVEVYKYNGTTFTLLGSSATTPEGITNGTAIDIYYTSVGIPETVLTITDRLAIRVYVTHSGRTITLHTEDNHLSEIITTFSNGLTALNGLTKQTQYLAVGTSGTDFAISSSVDTHTFNLPTASATNRGALSSANWSTFNNKQNAITLTTTGSSGSSTFIADVLNVPTYTLSGLGGVPTSRTITINGTSQDLSADRTYNVGTVTSVAALTLGTTGTDLSSTVANGTTTPVITLNVPTASASNRGALSAADWTTFNGKAASNATFTLGSTSIALGSTTTTIAGLSSVTSTSFVGSLTGSASLLNGYSESASASINSIARRDANGDIVARTYFMSNVYGDFAPNKLVGTGVDGQIREMSQAQALTYLNISGTYLPLAGGTLTGALSGTSATFSGTGTFGTLNSATIPLVANANTLNIGLKLIGTSVGNGNGTYYYANNGSTLLGSMNISGTAMAVTNEQAGIIYFATSGSEQARISSSGDFSIGTSSGGFKLNVNGTGNFSGALSGTSASFSSTVTATALIPTGASIPTNGMYLSAANTLAFSTNSLNRVTISSAGNVGIGIAAATERLHLANSTNGFVGLRLEGTGSYAGSDWTLYASSNSAPSADDFLGFYNNSATDSATVGYKFTLDKMGVATFINLAGTGSRAVLADANGVLSAPVSDISVKQNIKPIGYGLHEVMKMNPIWFNFIDEYKNFGEGRQNGNIAQEMAEIIPESVFITPSTKKMGINYDQLHAVYIKAIQELKAEIDILKNK